MTDLTPADLVAHIRDVTAIRPGDSLIVRLADNVRLPDVELYTKAIRGWFAERHPDVDVLILAGAIEELAVVRST